MEFSLLYEMRNTQDAPTVMDSNPNYVIIYPEGSGYENYLIGPGDSTAKIVLRADLEPEKEDPVYQITWTS